MGFRKDPKLSTRYVEIPLTRTALLYSPLSTGNTSEETLARILVGKYNDPNFGNIESRGYFTYAPPLQTATPDPAATFVSLELQLKFDYYSYGSVDSTDQTLRVVELLEPISADGQYTNNSTINISSTALGEQVFTPGPYGLKAGWKTNVDADPKNNVSFNVTIPITTGTIGQSLLAFESVFTFIHRLNCSM